MNFYGIIHLKHYSDVGLYGTYSGKIRLGEWGALLQRTVNGKEEEFIIPYSNIKIIKVTNKEKE